MSVAPTHAVSAAEARGEPWSRDIMRKQIKQIFVHSYAHKL